MAHFYEEDFNPTRGGFKRRGVGWNDYELRDKIRTEKENKKRLIELARKRRKKARHEAKKKTEDEEERDAMLERSAKRRQRIEDEIEREEELKRAAERAAEEKKRKAAKAAEKKKKEKKKETGRVAEQTEQKFSSSSSSSSEDESSEDEDNTKKKKRPALDLCVLPVFDDVMDARNKLKQKQMELRSLNMDPEEVEENLKEFVSAVERCESLLENVVHDVTLEEEDFRTPILGDIFETEEELNYFMPLLDERPEASELKQTLAVLKKAKLDQIKELKRVKKGEIAPEVYAATERKIAKLTHRVQSLKNDTAIRLYMAKKKRSDSVAEEESAPSEDKETTKPRKSQHTPKKKSLSLNLPVMLVFDKVLDARNKLKQKKMELHSLNMDPEEAEEDLKRSTIKVKRCESLLENAVQGVTLEEEDFRSSLLGDIFDTEEELNYFMPRLDTRSEASELKQMLVVLKKAKQDHMKEEKERAKKGAPGVLGAARRKIFKFNYLVRNIKNDAAIRLRMAERAERRKELLAQGKAVTQRDVIARGKATYHKELYTQGMEAWQQECEAMGSQRSDESYGLPDVWCFQQRDGSYRRIDMGQRSQNDDDSGDDELWCFGKLDGSRLFRRIPKGHPNPCEFLIEKPKPDDGCFMYFHQPNGEQLCVTKPQSNLCTDPCGNRPNISYVDTMPGVWGLHKPNGHKLYLTTPAHNTCVCGDECCVDTNDEIYGVLKLRMADGERMRLTVPESDVQAFKKMRRAYSLMDHYDWRSTRGLRDKGSV